MPRNDIMRDEEKPSDSISDISDSDTEMVTSSNYSNTNSGHQGEMYNDRYSNSENHDHSNITDSNLGSHQSAQFSLSNLSAFRTICKEQTTDASSSPYIPISPPNINTRVRSSYNPESFQKFKKFDCQRFGNLGLSLYQGFTSAPVSSTPNRQSLCPKTSSPIIDNDPSLFLHSDVRIPFANYFNNLVNTLQTAAAKGQLGKSRNLKEGNKNLFNFYWNRETLVSDNADCCSSTHSCTSTHGNYDSNIKSSNDMLTIDDDNSNRSQRRTHSSTPPSVNTTGTSSESSPILSGHFPRDQLCHQVSPHSHGLVSVPQYATRSAMRGPTYPTPGSYPVLSHPPYVPMTGYMYHRTNTEKATPAKKYKCDVCGKAFSRSNTLVTHKRIHTGAKPFKCEICGRAFRQPGNLTRHRLTHTSVKPYVCPQCNKAFNRASNLNTHMRTHSTFRHYSSSLSGKGFGSKSDLKSSFMYSTKRVGSFRH